MERKECLIKVRSLLLRKDDLSLMPKNQKDKSDIELVQKQISDVAHMAIDVSAGYKRPNIKHNELTKWNWMVGHPDGLVLGNRVDIGAFTYINAKFGVHIGDRVQIGGGCHIYSHNTINNTSGMVIIKEDAKIGAHCVILPGVIIGKGRIVKAGSIVTWANNNMSLDKDVSKKI